uniref:FecR family protein n=1 Tax=uncultured Draconibacterium sp. TaxID=1573823 RepID=UPI003217BC3A
MTKIEIAQSNKYKTFVESKKNLTNEEQVFEAGKLIREVEHVDVDSAFQNIQKRISAKGKILRIYSDINRYAAILLLPLIFVSIWALLNKSNEPTQELVFQEITCPIGMRSQVTLPDGSQVWLNSESVIKYSIPFVRENRSVVLIGQAFLDVTKNENSPFTIQSGNVKVNVVGTQFDFKSYPNDNSVEVILKEGKISLSLLSGENGVSNIEMIPGDHFTFDKTTKSALVSNKNIENYIGWKENKLIFDETPLPELKNILERWYGVEIEIADKSIESYKFTTTFNNESLHQVLELLELSSPIKIDYIPGKVDKINNEIIKAKIRISKKNNCL